MPIGREVAEAYIDVHGDLSSFRKDLEEARAALQKTFNDSALRRSLAGMTDQSTVLGRSLLLAGMYAESFGRKMRGLAGMNVLEDSFRFGLEFMENIDRNSVRIARMVTLIGTAASGLTTMIGGVAAISTDLAALGAIGFLAPGFLTGFGIAIGVAVAAFKDMKIVLADLKPAFAAMQDNISARFWEQAAQPIRNLANNLMPTLTRETGNVARAMGALFGEFARTFQGEATPERVTAMFSRLTGSIDISRKAMAPLVSAFVDLGEVGSRYFERFATWIVNLSNQFDAFITRSIANGDMDRWIERAITGFKDIGRVLEGTVGIIGAIDSAFRAAGGGGLKEFADRLQGASDVMNSPEFQTPLTQVFIGARLAMKGFFDGLGALGPAFTSLGPTFIHTGQQIGDSFRIIGDILNDVFGNDALQAGFEGFMSSITQSLRNLQPAAEPFAASLGSLLGLMGKVLEAVTRIGSQILQEWGPVLDTIGTRLGEMVGPLSEALSTIVTTLTPVLQSFSDNIIGPAVNLINTGLLPAIEGVVKLIGPSLTVALEEIGQLIKDLTPGAQDFGSAMEKAGTQGESLATNVRNVITAIEDFLNKASNPLPPGVGLFGDTTAIRQFDADVNAGLATFWTNVTTSMSTGITKFNADVNTWFSNLWPTIREGAQSGVTDLNRGVNEGLDTMWTDMRSGAQTGVESFNSDVNNGLANFGSDAATNIDRFNTDANTALSNAWTALTGGWNEGFSTLNADVNRTAGEIWNDFTTGITEGVGEVNTEMNRIAADIWNGFINGLTEGAVGLTTGIIEGFTGWVNDVRAFFGIHSPSTLFHTFGVDIVTGLINGLMSMLGQIGAFAVQLGTSLVEGFLGMVGQLGVVWGQITAGFAAFIGGFAAQWNAFWGGLGAFIVTALAGIGGFLGTALQGLVAGFQGFAAGFIAQWNAFWSGLGAFLGAAWAGISAVLAGAWAGIVAGVSGFVASVGAIWNTFWTGLSAIVGTVWATISGAVSAGVAAVSGAFMAFGAGITAAWNAFWNGLTLIVGTVWAGITAAVAAGIAGLQGFISGMVAGISAIWTGFWNGLVAIVSTIWATIVAAVGAGIAAVSGAFGAFGAAIAGIWNGFWGTLSVAVTVAWAAVTGVISGAIAGIQAFIAGGVAAIGAVWSAGWSAVSAFVSAAWGQITAAVSAGISAAQSVVAAGVNAISAVWTSVWSAVSSFISSTWSAIQGVISGGISAVQGVISGGMSAVQGIMSGAWSAIQGLISGAISAIQGIVSGGISAVQGVVSGGMSAVQGIMAGAWSAVQGLIAGAWGAITGTISGGVSQAIGLVSGMVSSIVGVIGGLAGQMVSAGANAIQGFINGMAGMISGVVGAAANIAGQAMAAVRGALNLGSPSKVFRQYGEWTGEGFAIGMNNMQGMLHNTATHMVDAVTSAFSPSTMYAQGRDAAQSLSAGLESNAGLVEKVMSNMTPTITEKFESLGGLPSGSRSSSSTSSVQKVFNFEKGALQLNTPTRDPEQVVSKFIDEFANLSNF